VLTGDVGSMARLAAKTNGAVRRVNVGGLHYREGRRERLRYVFLTDEEAAALRRLAAGGVVVTAQDVPTAAPVPVEDFT
jgi:mannose/fructose/N-acetylgalactosamine-specific phosphotransferase system component IIB